MTLSSVTKDPLLTTCPSTFDRQAYEITTKTTDAQKSSTKKAILNKDFRQAIMFAFNRKAYVAQANGEASADKVIRNTFTPPNFVQIDGKDFGESVEKNLEEYGDEWKGVSVEDGKDTLYNPTKGQGRVCQGQRSSSRPRVEFPIHWTSLFHPPIQKESSKLNPLNSRSNLP